MLGSPPKAQTSTLSMVKRRKSRRKKETNNFNFNHIKEYLSEKKKNLYTRFKTRKKKILDYLGKNYSKEIYAIKKFIVKIVGYGFIISIPIYTFSLAFIPKLFSDSSIFNIFSYPFFVLSFGIVWYFIEDEFITLFRRLIAKR